MSGPAPARLAAWRALLRLRASGDRLDDSKAALPELELLDDRDRGLANELVIGTVKRRLSLDAVLASFADAPLDRIAPEVHEALRLGAFQLLFLDRVPAHAAVDDGVALLRGGSRRTRGFANAVLRAVAGGGRERFAELSSGQTPSARAVRWSCPEWMIARLWHDLGPDLAERLLSAANEAPERCLRVNALRADVDTARAALQADGYTAEPAAALPGALLYGGPPLEISRAFAAGLVTPQSRGSQLAGLVAAGAEASPGALLDLCAAPGTKTAQLAAAHRQARVVAVERDPSRVTALRANLRRLGGSSVDVVEADGAALPRGFAGAFDIVLVDAPCSGLGTLAARPDLRWRRRAADVERLVDGQRRLTQAAARYVRPGGALTYAVCTVTTAETLAVVDGLARGGGWAIDDLGALFPDATHPANGAFLLALPPRWGTTAFFVARLRRQGREGDATRYNGRAAPAPAPRGPWRR